MSAKKKQYPTLIDSDMKLIRKSNELVEARYKFDIWETRVFAIMLTLLKAEDKEFIEYNINIGDILREFGLHDSGSVYESVKQASDKLLDKKVTIVRVLDDGRKENLTTHLVASTATPEERVGRDYVKLSFHPALKPFLLALQERYLVYDIRNILKLTSIYSVRLFELLKQYQKIGRRRFAVEELRMFLSIEPNEYKLYGHFKSLIKRSGEDLRKHTDIYFEIDEERVRNKVTHIIFTIHENSDIKITETGNTSTKKPKVEKPKVVVDENEERIYVMVSEHITKKKVAEWLKLFPISQIERGINYVKKYISSGNKVTNIGGFYNTMVATPNLYDRFEVIEKPTVVSSGIKSNSNEQEIESVLSFLKNLKKDFETKRINLETVFFQNNPNMKDFVTKKVQANMFYSHEKTIEENLTRDSVMGYWQSVIGDMFPEYYELTESYFLELGKQDRRLKELGYR